VSSLKNRILPLLVLLALPVVAQDANVLSLTPQEAEWARDLAARQRALDAQKEALRIEIIRAHLEAPQSQSGGCVVHQMLVQPEWGCGEFQFSRDFTSIVPASQLTGAPYGSLLYELKNGVAVGIKAEDEEADQ
jgi:hypothetical protein